jgi:hypothetical protein
MLANTPAAVAASPRPGSVRRLQQVYHETIVQQGRSEGFLISVSFLLTSLVVRAITHAIRDQRFKFLFHNISASSGLHIHHYVIGILVLLAAGFISIGFCPGRPWARRILAIAFGIAAALTLDEFAVWFRLQDVYWSPQGRESVDALILAGAISLLAVQGLSFWRAVWRDAMWLLFRRKGLYPEL